MQPESILYSGRVAVAVIRRLVERITPLAKTYEQRLVSFIEITRLEASCDSL